MQFKGDQKVTESIGEDGRRQEYCQERVHTKCMGAAIVHKTPESRVDMSHCRCIAVVCGLHNYIMSCSPSLWLCMATRIIELWSTHM